VTFYTSDKTGIGHPGVALATAADELGPGANKLLRKSCRFCGNTLGSPDPISPELTRAWFRPGFIGQCCAYCGTAKWKLHPVDTAEQLETKLQTNQEVAKKFKDWVEEAITHYKNGNRSTRFMSSAHDTLAREQSVDMVSGVKGKVKLYTTYEPRWGDPRTNKLGHTFCKDYRWKDGTLRLGGSLTLLH
jgi:hypothetical protein